MGHVRPHWRCLSDALAKLPSGELSQRWARGQRELTENSITFHVHGEPEGQSRRWQLDPVPMPIDAAEWAVLKRGLVQRVHLIEAILADLYGPRRLINDRLLPSALVYGNPAYLRPCIGIEPPKGRHLSFYAADLARGPDGRWRVFSDRTDVPGGIGYALENRQIVSRVLPEALQSCRVRPLEPFLEAFRASLVALTPRRFDVPRVVMLTPGAMNEAYFEHAYLAQHLGCMLAEAADLTVRDNRVFLKTLEGLRPVDVILRAVASSLCDPLELDSRSDFGIPGLLSAMRCGSVAVANTLGCGVVESTALTSYLPELCHRVLGEYLALPSVPAWWCGDPAGLSHVRANLERMVIKRTGQANSAVFGDTLSAAERERLTDAIGARPQDYVGQDIMALSWAPVWGEGEWVPQQVALRAFVAVDDSGPVVMDGGLTRITATRAFPSAALRRSEGGAKDTWVLSTRKEALQSAAALPLRLTGSDRDLTSRMADNVFWVGRYLERCEDLTRLLRPIFGHGLAPASGGLGQPLFLLLTQLGLPLAEAATIGNLGRAAAVLQHRHFDFGFATGLRANAERLLRTASAIRDRLSLDTWRNMQRLAEEMRAMTPQSDPGDIADGLNRVILTLEAASGLIMENMTRGLAWRFLDSGRRLERAIHVVDLLAAIVEVLPGEREASLAMVLDILDSAMTYRARYLASPQLPAVLDLLLCDETNPRSAGFQLAVLADHIDNFIAKSHPPRMRADQRLIVFLTGTVRTADIEVLCRPEEDGSLFRLGTVLEVLRSRLWELSEVITRDYFTHWRRRGNMG